ncbi:hypothetical protein [Solimonas terrae]|uniref:GDT1 family protein n=1 Tax=Solimonas terrae TaxID=1396819 RepID=A0A6M2BWP8_9GAMM|nr:hypothetical protein [Solimonas terrae]NGY06770.1 hypothetical protein [Solimonas terrae]
MLQVFITALSCTAIEFFETLAIAYALARAGYRREAIFGTLLGQSLIVVTALLSPWPAAFVPLPWLRALAALLLLGTGAYWSWKSWRRLRARQRPRWVEQPLDKIGVTAVASDRISPFVLLVMAKSSAVEALEVLIVVAPLALAAHAWPAALSGMLLAVLMVGALAVLLHGRLKAIPEVRLKLATGVLLMLIGLWWLVELVAA